MMSSGCSAPTQVPHQHPTTAAAALCVPGVQPAGPRAATSPQRPLCSLPSACPHPCLHAEGHHQGFSSSSTPRWAPPAAGPRRGGWGGDGALCPRPPQPRPTISHGVLHPTWRAQNAPRMERESISYSKASPSPGEGRGGREGGGLPEPMRWQWRCVPAHLPGMFDLHEASHRCCSPPPPLRLLLV